MDSIASSAPKLPLGNPRLISEDSCDPPTDYALNEFSKLAEKGDRPEVAPVFWDGPYNLVFVPIKVQKKFVQGLSESMRVVLE